MGMVSWVAADRNGLIYLLQRGDKADPVIVVDRAGKIVRSWGKGLYTTPHAIRVDPQGNVWTTDAASSMVYKFSPEGKTLLQIEVGGQPTPCGNFCSTTDIAFASDGHLFIADGYRNARILEYAADGKKLREWGSAGTGPGQFRLPHSIQIDGSGVVYVADRENGRIQRFVARGQVPRRMVAVRQNVRLEACRRRDVALEHSARSERRAGLADQSRPGERQAARLCRCRRQSRHGRHEQRRPSAGAWPRSEAAAVSRHVARGPFVKKVTGRVSRLNI